jgi:hypothetical protein
LIESRSLLRCLLDRNGFEPLLVALFDDPVVVSDFARFAERFGLFGVSRFNVVVERADDELLKGFDSIPWHRNSPRLRFGCR